FHVTGVQTCALPILVWAAAVSIGARLPSRCHSTTEPVRAQSGIDLGAPILCAVVGVLAKRATHLHGNDLGCVVGRRADRNALTRRGALLVLVGRSVARAFGAIHRFIRRYASAAVTAPSVLLVAILAIALG